MRTYCTYLVSQLLGDLRSLHRGLVPSVLVEDRAREVRMSWRDYATGEYDYLSSPDFRAPIGFNHEMKHVSQSHDLS